MDCEEIALSAPTTALAAEFLAMVDEYRQAGERYWFHDSARPDFAAYVRELEAMARGEGLLPGFVPMATYWLVRGGRTILGESRLRHRLTPALEIEGGHIGYAIRPSARRQGCGTLILKLTLDKARAAGLRRVLVTCDDDNVGSARIIEKNGGVRTGQGVSPATGKLVRQYWIEL